MPYINTDRLLIVMAEQTETILLPKIKKVEVLSKALIDPADFSKGLPKCKLPEIH
jgi:hypothetical protein